MAHHLIAVIIAAAIFMLLCSVAGAQPTSQPAHYLFASFRDNGQDGLHLAASDDGLHWSALNDDKSFLAPTVGTDRLMRDPCIFQGPDGTFHLVFTTSWHDRNIGYASSKDLRQWSPQRGIPVMEHEPDAKNCWAPEGFYDAKNNQFILFWATTIPGRFPQTDAAGDDGLNHRIYFVTTRDFQTFSPTKLLFDPGFSVIDATLISFGQRFAMIFKDETLHPLKKHLQVALADDPLGPFGEIGEPFTPSWCEGPTALRIREDWIVYYDLYRAHRYGAMRSRDLKQWEDVTDQLALPKGTRHGTAFAVSAETLAGLVAKP